jgi:hypothetical protein
VHAKTCHTFRLKFRVLTHAQKLLRDASLYSAGHAESAFNWRAFAVAMGDAVWQAIVVFGVPTLAAHRGAFDDLFSLGAVVMTAAVSGPSMLQEECVCMCVCVCVRVCVSVCVCVCMCVCVCVCVMLQALLMVCLTCKAPLVGLSPRCVCGSIKLRVPEHSRVRC